VFDKPIFSFYYPTFYNDNRGMTLDVNNFIIGNEPSIPYVNTTFLINLFDLGETWPLIVKLKNVAIRVSKF
jgi:hypothetical protein